MNKLITVVLLFISFLFFSSHVDHTNVLIHQYIGGELNPNLPDDPFNYEDQAFPEHIMFTDWGTNDTTILDLVTDHGATLGRVLFFDEKLSANENLSCGTCHKQALSFADDTPFSMGVSENTSRNSMQLNDLGWSNRTGFFWDMSENNLHDMIKLPLQNENEIGVTDIDQLIDKLNDTDYYPALFNDAFGDSQITEDRIADALTQFISSMTTFNSKFDRSKMLQDVLTASEYRGHELFVQNCEVCHTDGNSFFQFEGPEFFPFLFNNGLSETDDLGAGEFWGEEFNHLFKIPTLRNIVQTAPYMHDGRFESLEEVIDHYSEDLEDNEWTGEFLPIGGFQFSQTEKTDLINFMKTLTDEEFLENEKWSDPFDRSADDGNAKEIVQSVNLFPNPTSDFAIIETINPSQKMVEAVMYNSQGQFIKKMSSHNQQILFDVSQLSAGLYHIKLNCEDEQQTISLSVI